MSGKSNERLNPSEVLVDRETYEAKFSRKRLRIVAPVLMLCLLLAVTLWNSSKSSDTLRYRIEHIQRGNLTVTVTATGTLRPTKQVEVSSELSGIIKTVEVDYNTRVTVGQPLARLDTTKLEAQVKQYRANLDSAKAKVLQAEATVRETRSKLAQLKKVKELSNNKVPSRVEIDGAEATLARALADVANCKAAVTQAQATLDANLTDLSKTVIRSPINGVVLTRDAEPGQTVAATLDPPVLFTLAEDLTKMELIVDVDEADVGHIQEGQKAIFSVPAYPNRTFDAEIVQARFGSKTTSGVVTYETVLKVDNTDLSLRPGMTATADITVKTIKNAILVPCAALRFTPPAPRDEEAPTGLLAKILPHPPAQKVHKREDDTTNKTQRVWILKGGELVSMRINTGATNGTMTEVLSSELEPGMEVVVDILNTEAKK